MSHTRRATTKYCQGLALMRCTLCLMLLLITACASSSEKTSGPTIKVQGQIDSSITISNQ